MGEIQDNRTSTPSFYPFTPSFSVSVFISFCLLVLKQQAIVGEIQEIKPHEFHLNSYPSFSFVSELKYLNKKNNNNPPAKLPKWFGERPGKKPGDPESPDDVIFLKSHVHLFIIIFSSF